jgi:uncharacterized membrane protein YkvA (DUF1232 family)
VSGERGPSDGFPRDRFIALVGRFPKYARLAWRLARDDRLSRARQVALLVGAAYLVSPIDLVPGIIPVVGQLDDALVVLLAIRHALTGLPPADREAALAAAGLDERALDDDVRTIAATYAWLGRKGARFTWRAARTVARAGSRLGHRLAARARREA